MARWRRVDAGVPRWVLDALADVYDPCCREKGISVVDMGLLRSATVNGTHARVELMLTSGWCPFATHLLGEIEDALLAQPGRGHLRRRGGLGRGVDDRSPLRCPPPASCGSSPIPRPFPTGTPISPHYRPQTEEVHR